MTLSVWNWGISTQECSLHNIILGSIISCVIRNESEYFPSVLSKEVLIHLSHYYNLWTWRILMSLSACVALCSALSPALSVSAERDCLNLSLSLSDSVSPDPTTQPVLQPTVSRTIHARPTAKVNNSRSVVHVSTKGRQTDGWTCRWKWKDGSSWSAVSYHCHTRPLQTNTTNMAKKGRGPKHCYIYIYKTICGQWYITILLLLAINTEMHLCFQPRMKITFVNWYKCSIKRTK